MNYVIIGNGAAGVTAAEKLRKLDGKSEITILSAEEYSTYSKCLLADYLSGQIPEERMLYRDRDFYRRKGIQIQYGHKVTDIDFQTKTVTTQTDSGFSENGAVFSYDKLLIASGSIPVFPKIKGIENTNHYFLNTLEDAGKIMAASKSARRIIVIGGGYVGLEAAFNLYKGGREVTVMEKAPRILPGQLDEKASSIIGNSLEEEGIRLLSGVNIEEAGRPPFSSLTRLFKGNTGDVVVLEDGRRIKADMIVIAAGSKPNLPFVRDGALRVNKGVIVDRYMQTSIKDVYAAGDVVESVDAVTGKYSLSPIWPNAVIQGEYAAYNMAGMKKEFSDLISAQNSSEFREVPMIAMGITEAPDPECEVYVDYRPVEKIYRKVIIKGDVIIGMIFLGDIKNAGVIGSLMKEKVNVKRIKNNLLNSNFGYSEAASLV